jgi:hypothetical protein
MNENLAFWLGEALSGETVSYSHRNLVTTRTEESVVLSSI